MAPSRGRRLGREHDYSSARCPVNVDIGDGRPACYNSVGTSDEEGVRRKGYELPLLKGLRLSLMEVLWMADFGLIVKHDSGGKRLEFQCAHQNGLLYVVPSEASWVCSDELLHAHALAGFFKQLSALNDVRVKEIMQRWGLYFRERPLATQDEPSQTEG